MTLTRKHTHVNLQTRTLAVIHGNRATGMQKGDKGTFVVQSESSSQVVTTLLSCVYLCVSVRAMVAQWRPPHLAPVRHCQSSKNGQPFLIRCRPMDNRPFCVCEAGGVYFLDVGLIFQAGGQTEGWPLFLSSMTLLTKNGLRGMESKQEWDLFMCVF